jgi:trk system potassium uptake protein TrkA
MNIVIAGGGRVGFHLARLLSGEHQNVTVIESNTDQLEQIDFALDVSTVNGDASSVTLLQSIGVGDADLFVASMGNDETNLIAAATAKGLGAKQVVARVDHPKFIEANILYETVLGLDYILSPDALSALEVANYIQHPGILASEDFGRGLVQMRQIRVAKSPTTNGLTLKDILPPGSGVLLGVLVRNGESSIPHGDSVIEPGDHVTLVGHREKMCAVQKIFQGEEQTPRRVAIMGGSTIGLRLAQALEGKVRSVKIFERNEARSNELASQLKKAKVVCRDATSKVALQQEHTDSVDVFVAATADDEKNIMAAVLAKEVGARSVVAVVHQPDFAALVERLGVDLAVTPRASFANRILKLVHQQQVTALAVLSEGSVEVLEFTVGDGSPVLGHQLKDVAFPLGALVATILRGDNVIVPSGEDEIRAGDAIILIATADSLEAARKILQKKR